MEKKEDHVDIEDSAGDVKHRQKEKETIETEYLADWKLELISFNFTFLERSLKSTIYCSRV